MYTYTYICVHAYTVYIHTCTYILYICTHTLYIYTCTYVHTSLITTIMVSYNRLCKPFETPRFIMKRWAGAAAVFGPTLVAARASAPGLGSPFAKANFSVDPSGLGFGVCDNCLSAWRRASQCRVFRPSGFCCCCVRGCKGSCSGLYVGRRGAYGLRTSASCFRAHNPCRNLSDGESSTSTLPWRQAHLKEPCLNPN